MPRGCYSRHRKIARAQEVSECLVRCSRGLRRVRTPTPRPTPEVPAWGPGDLRPQLEALRRWNTHHQARGGGPPARARGSSGRLPPSWIVPKPSQPVSPVDPFQGSVDGLGGGPMACIHHDTGLLFAVFLPTPPYKTIPKQDGGLRPILDLRGLNKFLRPWDAGCWQSPGWGRPSLREIGLPPSTLRMLTSRFPYGGGHWHFLRFAFEALAPEELKWLSLKTVFLLAHNLRQEGEWAPGTVGPQWLLQVFTRRVERGPPPQPSFPAQGFFRVPPISVGRATVAPLFWRGWRDRVTSVCAVCC